MINFYKPLPQPAPHTATPPPTPLQNNRFSFSYNNQQRPKMLYIDIINQKPGCKRCGK